MSRSKFLASFSACLLLSTSIISAQTNRYYFDEAKGRYFSLTMGIGNYLGRNPDGIIAASIPYTSMDALGHVTTNTFTVSHQGLYTKAIDYGQCNYITFEFGNRTFFADYKFSGNIMDRSGVISAGRRFQLGRNFAAKVSMGVTISEPWKLNVSSTGYDSLGSIDNNNKTINILGHSFGPTLNNSNGQAEKANQLSVYYSQSNISLVPRVSFGQSDYRHFYYWDFFLEYYLPMTKTGEINLYQNNVEPSTDVIINRHSDLVTYNGHPAGKIPAVFHGFYAGFTLGISISGKDRRYDRQKHTPRKSVQRYRQKKHKQKAAKVKKQIKDDRGKDNSRGW